MIAHYVYYLFKDDTRHCGVLRGGCYGDQTNCIFFNKLQRSKCSCAFDDYKLTKDGLTCVSEYLWPAVEAGLMHIRNTRFFFF